MKQAVMYGGGNIGRGFIGATLSQSGYEVTFIDVAEPVIQALQEKHCYPVRYVSGEGYEDVLIENVTAVSGNDQEAASEAIANCDIMATAVGARILKFIVPNIVAGLRKRWARTDAPLNIIICENLNDANHNHRPCRWFAQAPLGPITSRTYRFIESSFYCMMRPTAIEIAAWRILLFVSPWLSVFLNHTLSPAFQTCSSLRSDIFSGHS